MMWLQTMYLSATDAIRSVRDREEGQGLVEYALIIALVSVLLITALGVLRGDIASVFTDIGSALNPS